MTCTEKSFLADVANHTMRIIREDGINRHLRFQVPGTGIDHFDLVTWSNNLVYTGDMGTYVFRRLTDMFVFFRSDRQGKLPDGATLHINPSYWAEKLEAIDRDGVTQYNPEVFTAALKAQLEDYLEGYTGDAEALRQEVEDDVLCYADDGQQAAVGAAMDFVADGRRIFEDFHEVDVTEYTHRFLWCCYAMAWGIQKYDEDCAAKLLLKPEAEVLCA